VKVRFGSGNLQFAELPSIFNSPREAARPPSLITSRVQLGFSVAVRREHSVIDLDGQRFRIRTDVGGKSNCQTRCADDQQYNPCAGCEISGHAASLESGL
jgi:hypothetical protein